MPSAFSAGERPALPVKTVLLFQIGFFTSLQLIYLYL
jgi:hypothetical protein